MAGEKLSVAHGGVGADASGGRHCVNGVSEEGYSRGWPCWDGRRCANGDLEERGDISLLEHMTQGGMPLFCQLERLSMKGCAIGCAQVLVADRVVIERGYVEPHEIVADWCQSDICICNWFARAKCSHRECVALWPGEGDKACKKDFGE